MTMPCPRGLFRLLATLPLVLAIAACSWLSTPMEWLTGPADPNPPSPPPVFQPSITITNVWSARVGSGTGKQWLRLMPALDAEQVYAASFDGTVQARRLSDGSLIWEVRTGLPITGGPGAGEGLVVVGTAKAEVVALEAISGQERWRASLSGPVLSVPKIQDGRVVVQASDNTLYGFDARDGSRQWLYSVPLPVLTVRGSGAPVIIAGHVLAGFAGGKLSLLTLKEGIPRWETTVSPPSGRSELERIVDPSAEPVTIGEVAFVPMYQGELTAVALRSGEVIWRRKISSFAGLAVSTRGLFVTDSDDRLWALDLRTGAALWKQEKLLHRRLSAPALLDNALVVGDLEGYVHWLSAEDGGLLARASVGHGPIAAQPQPAKDRVVVLGQDGALAVLAPGGGSR
ncbi:Outer membrane protein assembly factor BamB [Gammaproteobacteria bacterium]